MFLVQIILVPQAIFKSLIFHHDCSQRNTVNLSSYHETWSVIPYLFHFFILEISHFLKCCSFNEFHFGI